MSNGFDVRGRTLRAGELAVWLSEHSLGNRFGLSVVVSTPDYTGKAVALAIVAADGEGRYVEVAELTPDDEAALVSWLADPGPPKAVHDAKSAMHALGGCGWTLRGVTSDTVLAAHLLVPDRETGGLNDLLIRHMRCALPAKVVAPMRDDDAAAALILKTCALLDLADVLDEELARIDSSALLHRLELPAQRVLTQLEATGVAVNRALLAHTDVPKSISSDGRIHPAYHQFGTATGMPAWADPDLPAAPELRDVLVAGHGYAELMFAGYRRLEEQIAEHLGAGATDLRGLVDEAQAHGFASTLLGRRQYLPDLAGNSGAVRAAAERAAVAMAVQGSAADIMKLAMIAVDQAIAAGGLRSRMVAQAGEELVFEVAAGEGEQLAEYVKESMVDAYPLHTVLEVSLRFGSR